MFFIRSDKASVCFELATKALPIEASGLLLMEQFRGQSWLSVIPTSSHKNTPVSFMISEREINRARSQFACRDQLICGCFHSHVFKSATPSKYDELGACTELPLWLIASLKSMELKLYLWNGSEFIRQRITVR